MNKIKKIKELNSQICTESFNKKHKYRLYRDGIIRCFFCQKEIKTKLK